MNHKNYKLHTGFTLIEMMVTLTITAVILVFAAPGFTEMIRKNRLDSGVNAFNSTLNLARSVAVKEKINVTVCKSTDNASCTAGGTFSQGWIAFIDDGATIGTVDAGETILRAHSALHPTSSFTGTTVVLGSNAANFVTYTQDGTTPDRGAIALCDNSAGNYGKTLHIRAIGRNRISTGVTCP